MELISNYCFRKKKINKKLNYRLTDKHKTEYDFEAVKAFFSRISCFREPFHGCRASVLCLDARPTVKKVGTTVQSKIFLNNSLVVTTVPVPNTF